MPKLYVVATRDFYGTAAVFRVGDVDSYVDAMKFVADTMKEEGVPNPVVLSLVSPVCTKTEDDSNGR